MSSNKLETSRCLFNCLHGPLIKSLIWAFLTALLLALSVMHNELQALWSKCHTNPLQPTSMVSPSIPVLDKGPGGAVHLAAAADS